MVVVQDHAGRLADQRAAQDLAGFHDRAIERAAVDLRVVLQEPIARVQKQCPCPLLRVVGLGLPQELFDQPRLVHQVAAGEGLRGKPAGDLERSHDRAGARRPDATLGRELRRRRPGQTDEPAPRGKKAPRPVEGTLSGNPRAQEQRQQLFVRQCARAQAQQPLARPLIGRQIADAESTSRELFGHGLSPTRTACDPRRTRRSSHETGRGSKLNHLSTPDPRP